MARKAKTFGSATPKKMAKGGSASKGSASASKSSAAKGGAAPAAKSGGSAAGRTINTSSVRTSGGGGGGMLSNITNAVRGAFSGGNKMTTVSDPKTGQSYAKPSYSGVSLRGLTSTDPANVARNRAAAARYAELSKQNAQVGGGRDTAAATATTPTAPTTAAPTTPIAPTAPPTMTYVPAPVGYRPGIDPEHKFYQARPTVVLKKGGKIKPKGKK